MPDASDLHALAESLLAASVDALDTLIALDLDGAPDRAFVSYGPPALDCCDQLTVNVTGIGEAATNPLGLPAGNRNRSARIDLVTLVVTISRCVPVPDDRGNPPPVADMEASAAQGDADAWALWNHLWSLWLSRDLFTLCGEVFWDGMRPLGPSGGCGAWTLTLRARLDGYDDVPAS